MMSNFAVKNNRINWIDNLRGICMILICLHHTGPSPVWFAKLYNPIFLTSFFFVSGYLFYNPSRIFNIKQKILNIITSLIIPYFIYCFCCICIAFILQGFDGLTNQLYLSLSGIKSWFISALILCQIFSLVNFVFTYKLQTLIITSLIALLLYFYLPPGIYFWNFRNSLLAYPFLACGIIARIENSIDHIINNKYIGKCCLLLYLICVSLDTKYNLLNGSFNESYSSYIIFFIENIVGIPAIIYSCNKITKFNWLLLFIGANSLLYYYLPSLTNIVTIYLLSFTGITNTSFIILIFIVFFKCLLMVIPVLMINKYFPVFAGKYRIRISEKR